LRSLLLQHQNLQKQLHLLVVQVGLVVQAQVAQVAQVARVAQVQVQVQREQLQ